MNNTQTLTLIVPEESTGPARSAKAEDFDEEALLPAPLTRMFSHQPKEVPLDKLKNGLKRAQAEVEELLADAQDSTVAGFRLNSIEVSLAISAGGSIGLATAGVEASMTLSFERVSTK